MSRPHHTVLGGAMLGVAVLCGAALRAAPYLPAHDEVVVEVLAPGSPGPRVDVLTPLGSAVPRENAAAEEFALHQRVRSLIGEARDRGDPRALGRAEALLRVAPAMDPPPLERLVLQATIDQSLHRFDAAVRGLDAVLARDPLHAQARLTRATVLQVQGRLAAAARDCASLARVVSPLVARTCGASVASLDGRAVQARVLLEDALQQATSEPAEVVSWSRTLLAGILERLGEPAAAADQYAEALRLVPDDRYARAAAADLWLDSDDPSRALALVAGRRADDALLLREALARAALHDPGRDAASDELARRYAAARRRGESLHLREEARFELHLRGDVRRALDLARRNWQVQHEPADARILLESAFAANDAPALAEAHAWYARAGVAPAVLARWTTSPVTTLAEGRP